MTTLTKERTATRTTCPVNLEGNPVYYPLEGANVMNLTRNTWTPVFFSLIFLSSSILVLLVYLFLLMIPLISDSFGLLITTPDVV